MKTPATILNLLLLLVVISLTVILTSMIKPQTLSYGAEYEVRVINGFRDNSSLPLVIWCSTENGDDLGGRALQEGDDFGWTLKTYFWGTTRYYCTMKWDAIRKRFEAFKVPRDSLRCGSTRKCSWLVREDGFYFSSDEVNWTKDFSWI